MRKIRGEGPVLWVWLFLLVATNIPYARAWALPPRGTAFLGFFYALPDVYNYLSYVQQATDGQFLFQPSLQAGSPATLLGYPLIEAEDMPDIAASSLSIAFGNFKAGYVIAERNATTILRDPYTHKPYVHFYATKRVGGQVVNSESIKLLKFA